MYRIKEFEYGFIWQSRTSRVYCLRLVSDVGTCPFDYDQAGIAYYKPDRNTGTEPLNDQATIDFRLAYQRCPTHAIKRSDHPFNARPFSETGKA